MHPSHWNLDKILDDLNDAGFALIDEVYPNEYVQALVG